MSGGDGYLTNALYREIAKLMTDAGISHRVEQGAKHFHVKFMHLGVERTQILHLGPNNKGSSYRKTVIRFRKIVAAHRAYVAPQEVPELELERPTAPAQETAQPSFDLALRFVDEEPRVLDTDLAAALGMVDLHKVRPLIRANLSELQDLGAGGLSARQAESTGGRPASVYHLNEEQALLICMLSRTDRAKQVRAEVIRVFTAWRRGQLAPAVATIDTDAMKASAQLAASAAGGAAKNAVAPHMRQVDGRLTHLDDRLTELAKWSQQVRRETNRNFAAILSIIGSPSAVSLQMSDYIEIGGVYEVAGLTGTVPRRGLLSANMRRALDDFCLDRRILPTQAKVRGQKIRHWPKATVADWLAAEGHALIERHMRANAPRLSLVSSTAQERQA